MEWWNEHAHIKNIVCITRPEISGCLDSVEWNGGMSMRMIQLIRTSCVVRPELPLEPSYGY